MTYITIQLTNINNTINNDITLDRLQSKTVVNGELHCIIWIRKSSRVLDWILGISDSNLQAFLRLIDPIYQFS